MDIADVVSSECVFAFGAVEKLEYYSVNPLQL